MLKYSKTLIVLLLISFSLNAKLLFVDNQLSANTSSYSIENRSTGGSDGNAYKKIQDAVNAMDTGDTIYLRDGTYYEVSISLTSNRHGSAGAPNVIRSYKDEWAIIDGQYGGVDNSRAAVFWCTGGGRPNITYWVFERMEITGGGHPTILPGRGSGIYMESASHCEFRYLYIHDNYENQSQAAAGGIQLTAGANNNIIEYCYFKCNGNPFGERNDGNSQIAIYSDYKYGNPVDINTAMSKNVIRYNLMDGACSDPNNFTPYGVMHKGFQRLTGYNHGENQNPGDALPNDGSSREYGDQIHHNIIINSGGGMRLDQDYMQAYNNIIHLVRRPVYGATAIHTRDMYTGRRGSFWACIYNNTIFADHLDAIHYRVYPDNYDCTDGLIDYGYGFAVNNIIQDADKGWDWAGGISFGAGSQSNCDNNFPDPLDLNNYNISRNLFFECTESDAIARFSNRDYTVEEIMQTPAADLVWKINSGTMFKGDTGTAQYKALDYALDGTYSIANGGLGGSHPYLSGVAIPSYVGASDPNDDAWVDIVHNLKDLNSGYAPAISEKINAIMHKNNFNISSISHANGSITFNIKLNKDGNFNLSIYNVNGKKTAATSYKNTTRGNYNVKFNNIVNNGMYLAVLKQNNKSVTKKFVVVK
jgi:hypothetical protein